MGKRRTKQGVLLLDLLVWLALGAVVLTVSFANLTSVGALFRQAVGRGNETYEYVSLAEAIQHDVEASGSAVTVTADSFTLGGATYRFAAGHVTRSVGGSSRAFVSSTYSFSVTTQGGDSYLTLTSKGPSGTHTLTYRTSFISATP